MKPTPLVSASRHQPRECSSVDSVSRFTTFLSALAAVWLLTIHTQAEAPIDKAARATGPETELGITARCGQTALANLALALSLDPQVSQKILDATPPKDGFNVTELLTLAKTNGLALRAVIRPPKAEIPLPAILHWRFGHYSAALERKGSRYLLDDPFLGGQKWEQLSAIDKAASGAVLLPAASAPSSWLPLDENQSARLRGSAVLPVEGPDDQEPPIDCCNDSDDQDADCDPPSANDGADLGDDFPSPPPCCCDMGMPTWHVSEPYLNVWILDRPLGYRTSNGKWMHLRVIYKSRGFDRGLDLGGFGPHWECNWLGSLKQSSNSPTWFTNYLAGGGFSVMSEDRRDYKTARQLGVASSPQITSPRGAVNRYGYTADIGLGITNHFMDRRTDRYGRAVRYNYETVQPGTNSITRLTTVVDIDGRTNTLAYTNSLYPHLITSVTDPYGRSACFAYDVHGRLIAITDMAGISSTFEYNYETNQVLGTVTTPYGQTTFAYFETNASRAVLVTEASGENQLYVLSGGLTGYSSFHWNRSQFVAISDTISWMADPVDPLLGYRPAAYSFTYQGQDSSHAAGTLKRVTSIYLNSTLLVEIGRNSLGRPTAITNYNSDSTTAVYTNTFDGSGSYLQKQIGPRGELLRGYGYQSSISNLLTSVTNAAGDVTRYTHDTNTMKVTSVTFPTGLVRTNFYFTNGPSQGFLQKQIDIGFRTNSFAYENGNLLVETNELGLVTTNLWDPLHRLVSTAFPDATTISNIYDKLDLVATKDRLGHWTRYSFDAVRQLSTVTNANGQGTIYSWCGCGSPDAIIRWNGAAPIVTYFDYDIAGRLTNTIYPDDYQVSRAYDDQNRLQTITDSGGRHLELDYARIGLRSRIAHAWLVSESAGERLLLANQYDEYARPILSLDRNGVIETNQFDELDRIIARRFIGASGDQISGLETFGYNSRGLAFYTNQLGKITTDVRDENSRLLYETNANNETLGFSYNPSDQLLTLTDGKNQTTSWVCDEYGRLARKVDAAGHDAFIYTYDANNRLTSRSTPEKGTTYYTNDPLGNLVAVVYPVSSSIFFTYDGLNRLTTMVDGTGTNTFTWTDGGLLAGETGPWVSNTVSYVYTNRQRVSMTLQQPNMASWTQTYGYNEFGLLTNTASPAGSFDYRFEEVYSSAVGAWTASDLIQSLAFPGGSYITNSHDDLSRLLSTALRRSDGALLNFHTYEYNSGSQRTKQTFTAGNYMDYTYDDISQLKTAIGKEANGTSRLHEQFGYAYDAAWNLNRRTNNALVQTFNVNNLNELTNATREGTFTVAGNTSPGGVSATVNGAAAEFYNDLSFAKSGLTITNGNNTFTAVAQSAAGSNAAASVTANLPATSAFASDLNGNLRTNGLQILEYNDENELTSVTVSNAWRSQFVYDGLMRRRIRREFTWSSGNWVLTNEVRYLYDQRLVIQERDTNNLPVAAYTRGNDLSGTLQAAGGIGGLLARTDTQRLALTAASPHAYYHADGNGNVTALVNENQLLLANYSYDPFGSISATSGFMAEKNLYRFSSKEQHPDSGLLYYLYRYCDASLQRWPNQDPLADIASAKPMKILPGQDANTEGDEAGDIGSDDAWININRNLYTAVGNEPASTVDFFGLQASLCNPAGMAIVLDAEAAAAEGGFGGLAAQQAAAAAAAVSLAGDRAETRAHGQGERKYTAKPEKYKGWRIDPKDPTKVKYRDPQTGKWVTKPKPADFPCKK